MNFRSRSWFFEALRCCSNELLNDKITRQPYIANLKRGLNIVVEEQSAWILDLVDINLNSLLNILKEL